MPAQVARVEPMECCAKNSVNELLDLGREEPAGSRRYQESQNLSLFCVVAVEVCGDFGVFAFFGNR
jgi:hypothetical protein